MRNKIFINIIVQDPKTKEWTRKKIQAKEIFNWKSINLGLHRGITSKGETAKFWNVTELKTGLAIARECNTMKEAKEEAISLLEIAGEEKTLKVIKSQLKKYKNL